MFSGIIQAVVPVHAIHEKNNLKQFSIILPNYLLTNLKIGSSISNNGCCLTVISIKSNLISFELIYETLKLTNMNLLRIGDLINIERSLNYNAEIGGHLMSGHIDCTGTIKKIIQSTHQKIFWFNLKNQTFQKYILPHGSIGIEGVSLTINKIIKNNIRICLTPYTAINTTLGKKKIGDIINIEIDIITKSIVNSINRTLSIID